MPLTPEDVLKKQFTTTHLKKGYDENEVDDYLDIVANELRLLLTENDDLGQKLSACEARVGELSRAVAGGTTDGTGAPGGSLPAPGDSPATALPAGMQAADTSEPEQASAMLALAQRLHDEHVRLGEEKRSSIVAQAQAHAAKLVEGAEARQQETMASLEQQRGLLERTIEELRAFEREYRSRLKAYLQTQLEELDARGAVVPARDPATSQPDPAATPADG